MFLEIDNALIVSAVLHSNVEAVLYYSVIVFQTLRHGFWMFSTIPKWRLFNRFFNLGNGKKSARCRETEKTNIQEFVAILLLEDGAKTFWNYNCLGYSTTY